MSKNDEKASEGEQGEQKSVSVLDYIYCDTRRIASFLAQFDDAGHLLKITESESASTGTRQGFRLGGGATILGTGGHINVERAPTEQGSEATERVYDPLWTNARAFMDYLADGNMIQFDLSQAKIGQFVLVSGSLDVRDLKLIQKAMAVFSKIREPQAERPGSRDTRNRSKAWHENQQAKEQAELQKTSGLEFLGMLPHAVHAVLQTDEWSAWCSLRPEALVVSSDDIFLNHGVRIPGEWYILGILDAQPDAQSQAKAPNERYADAEAAMTEVGENSMVTLFTKGFGGFIDGIAPFARLVLGRQSHSYGMTPLLIFRKVSAERASVNRSS